MKVAFADSVPTCSGLASRDLDDMVDAIVTAITEQPISDDLQRLFA